MTEVELKNGGVALVDDEDFEKVSVFTWRRRPERHTTGYAFTVRRDLNTPEVKRGKLRYILMHRFILGLKDPKVVVDHKNHNGLDNRRENIRPCTHAENMANRRKKITNPTHE